MDYRRLGASGVKVSRICLGAMLFGERTDHSPLARGVLTGKYEPHAAPPPDSRAARGDRRLLETEFRPHALEDARELRAHAANRGLSLSHFALSWVLGNPLVTAALAGPLTLEQWQDYLAALGKPIDAEDEARVNALVPAGYVSSYGYADPKYPVTGRPRRA